MTTGSGIVTKPFALSAKPLKSTLEPGEMPTDAVVKNVTGGEKREEKIPAESYVLLAFALAALVIALRLHKPGIRKCTILNKPEAKPKKKMHTSGPHITNIHLEHIVHHESKAKTSLEGQIDLWENEIARAKKLLEGIEIKGGEKIKLDLMEFDLMVASIDIQFAKEKLENGHVKEAKEVMESARAVLERVKDDVATLKRKQ